MKTFPFGNKAVEGLHHTALTIFSLNDKGGP